MSNDLDRRDFLVGQAVQAAKRSGAEVDPDAIARQAGRDLEIVDRMRAAGVIQEKRSAKAERKVARREAIKRRAHVVEDLAAQKQARFYEAAPIGEDAALPKLFGLDAMRLAAMHQRIAMICKPVPGYRLKPGEPIGNQCQYPSLANLALMHTACFARAIGSYKGLSYEDRQRKYQRAIEDICDRSNAVIPEPGWWVGK